VGAELAYVLEHAGEFDRLERQSALPSYDYLVELQGLDVEDGAHILDAGCGSGVVSRYLANTFPNAEVTACDMTASLLHEARQQAHGIGNLRFFEQNLKSLSFDDASFDLIVCRFVLHHQSAEGRELILSELVRVLKPGGRIIVIDIDGVVLNLYPQTAKVSEGLNKIAAAQEIDLFAGRKIPHLFFKAGLTSISWKVQTVDFQGETKQSELQIMRERFTNAAEFLQRVIGDAEALDAFKKEYLECLERDDSVGFFNKFIVSAVKV